MVIAVIFTVVGAALFAAIVLWGARIDGRRQALRNRGLHPTTTEDGDVVPREQGNSQH